MTFLGEIRRANNPLLHPTGAHISEYDKIRKGLDVEMWTLDRYSNFFLITTFYHGRIS